jgi:hypothetical protein
MIPASTFQLGLVFFGLTFDDPKKINELRALIYKQIHQICFYGKGGYSWPVVYNMPLYLRKFVFNEIKLYHDEQNEQSNKHSQSPNKKVVTPSTNNQSFPKRPSQSPSQPKKEVKIPLRIQYK